MTYAIEAHNICKKFADKQVLKGINLRVPEQSVYGFLGNNGAGKSTFIRSLLGLLNHTGEFKLFGKPIHMNDSEYRFKIGALVDSPSLYQHLTAAEFLRITQSIKKLNKSEIDRALSIVGLDNDKTRKIEHFSLGMKQRLAIAQALMGEPELLVLDEPTNGLDPSGMVEIRELLSALPKQTGTTVFLSSHLLDEIEKTATHVAILKHGKVSIESSLTDLLNQTCQRLMMRTTDPIKLEQLLLDTDWAVEIQDERVIVKNCSEDDAVKLHHFVSEHRIPLIESRLQKNKLEDFFHEHNAS